VKRIYVDFSVYTPSASEGWVHGVLEMPHVPGEGESLSFETPKANVSPLDVPGFIPKLVVEHVSTEAGSGPENIALSLADVTVPTSSDADKLFSYFEHGFGLDFDRTKDWTHA
jgi:hypothetical protein